MTQADLRKPKALGNSTHLLFVLRIKIAVQKDHGERAKAALVHFLEVPFDLFQIRRTANGPVEQHAFVYLDDLLGQRFWLFDFEGKQIGPVLVSDFQQISKPFRDDQANRLALSFQQRIGGPRSCPS